jgi:hypothetical protein
MSKCVRARVRVQEVLTYSPSKSTEQLSQQLGLTQTSTLPTVQQNLKIFPLNNSDTTVPTNADRDRKVALFDSFCQHL